jgi:hypothetical protein
MDHQEHHQQDPAPVDAHAGRRHDRPTIVVAANAQLLRRLKRHRQNPPAQPRLATA